ncbi:hypothetical protein NT6N_08620 [Oceaniferula spumae]|uniref:Uncharacterized protein n=1 Tax=Oceaniferula spumae TaxID=2979115 RepID=A0AAT9FIQ3_9BACT
MSDNESSSDAESPKPEVTGDAGAAKKTTKKKSAKKAAEQLPDLSSLNFGPAWARKDQPKKGREASSKRRDSGNKDTRSSGHKQGGRRDDHRGAGQREGGRPRRNDNRGRDSRDGGRGRDRRDHRDRPPLVPAPDGFKARIMPIEEGLDALAKQISATGRTHSVFDLAWLVLGGLERFHVIFESKKDPIYRSRSDHSVWLYQKECLDHFWNHGGLEKYYDEEVTEVEPPKGNFQSVARCGFSGTLIGPPNHHAYQQTLLDLHRERFSNMPLDRYKQKITMEHGEEAVEAWLESMKKHVRWRPKSETPSSDDSKKETEAPAEASSDDATEAPKTEEAPAPVIEETVVILDNRREVEQHFIANGFEKEFESGTTISSPGNIPAKLISPALLTLQKNTVTEARRYPGDLASILCRQMSGRHLAVFKWKKRLHCGPARPKHVPDDLVMADRPTALFKWVIANPSGNIDAMWKELLPKDIDDDTRHLWYHDLHWLINEGFVLLFSDGTLHAAKELEKPAAKKTAKKKTAAKPKQPKEEKKPEAPVEPPAELKKAIEAADIPEAAPEEKNEPDAPADPNK